MNGSWSFGQKIGAGFATMVAFAVVIGLVGIYSLTTAVASKDVVITANAQALIDVARLSLALEQKAGSGRAFLLSKDARLVEEHRASRTEFLAILGRLRKRSLSPETTQLLDQLERREAEHQAAWDTLIEQRTQDASLTLEGVSRRFDELARPKYAAVDQVLTTIVEREERLLEAGKQASSDAARSAIFLETAIVGGAVLLALSIALALSRTLGRQIGAAVQHIQSSSAELQAAANQQATGTKEQVSAMTEITTTIRELLSTSRQIAESAQRVVQIAEDTAGAARGGDHVVQRAQEAIAAIKRQVDVVVTHMLELGKRSQQIGGVLEVVNELLEQTNILAINATIEASGAGEHGKRFAAVADEIRKLSDRVGAQAKEIRGLVEEVRAAVNGTVMATEGGAKAVDAGTRQFGEVATAFQKIAGQVGTTTEAAREIELSTKQQTSAVEQVNVAIANVSQAARESEASAAQTLQTASELTKLSHELLRLVRSDASYRDA